MIFSHRVWEYIPEGSSNILYDILEPQIAHGEKVFGFRVDNMRWFETGNAEEYLAATKTCLELMNSSSVLGRCAHDILETLSPHTEFKNMQLISETADVSEDAQLSGFVVIGDGARVESGAQLQNCVLLPGSHAGKNESVSGKILI
jgi:NDP-sugar pyrophosphorylase family protein